MGDYNLVPYRPREKREGVGGRGRGGKIRDPEKALGPRFVDPLSVAMASSSKSSGTTVSSKSKLVPQLVSALLDLAIYSFGCQSGLRSNHKVRGDPVLEGVSAFLGRMLLTSNAETQAAFEEITATRLGK